MNGERLVTPAQTAPRTGQIWLLQIEHRWFRLAVDAREKAIVVDAWTVTRWVDDDGMHHCDWNPDEPETEVYRYSDLVGQSLDVTRRKSITCQRVS